MKLTKKKVFFPFYHIVANKDNELTSNLYASKNKKQFLEDIQYLKKKLDPLTVDFFTEEKIEKNESGFFLTFDDGLSNFYDTVVPLLEKEKISAMNFVNTKYIDNTQLFFRYKVNLILKRYVANQTNPSQEKEIKKIIQKPIISFLKSATQKEDLLLDKIAEILHISFTSYLLNKQPYLTKSQIIKLSNKGFYIGAHGKTHPYYHTLTSEEQLEEIIDSTNYLETEFNTKNRFFSFPFSDYGVSKDVFKIIQQENIISFGTAGLKDQIFKNHYQRIPMEYSSIYSAETILKGELIYYLIKIIFRKNKIDRN